MNVGEWFCRREVGEPGRWWGGFGNQDVFCYGDPGVGKAYIIIDKIDEPQGDGTEARAEKPQH